MKYFFLTMSFLMLSCKADKKYHQVQEPGAFQGSDTSLQAIATFQKKLNAEFKNPETSPLPDRYRKNFETLHFFEADTSYTVQATLVRTPNTIPFEMPTTTNRKSKERVYGVLHFYLKGGEHQLEVYQNEELMQQEGYEDYLFLPFTDDTNGTETYGGGRYIDLEIPTGDSLLLDFNRAYNPYCVYNKKYSCPIVPAVNALNVAVRAGVKDFKPLEK